MNPFIISFLAISLDYGSTKYALSQGAIESNPILYHHLEAKKAAQVIAIGYGLNHLKKKNKKLYKITVIGLFIVNGIFAVHNIRQGLKTR